MRDIEELPDDKETKAYRAAVAILRESPDLDVVRTWGVLLDDQDEAAACFVAPTLDMMPMIRIFPSARDDRGATTMQSTCTIAFEIRAFTAGIDSRHLLNLWAAIRRAWIGTAKFRKTTVKCYLDKELQATRFDVTSPGYGRGPTSRDNEPPYYLSGVGQVEIDFLRPR